jgi:hypothetical protein
VRVPVFRWNRSLGGLTPEHLDKPLFLHRIPRIDALVLLNKWRKLCELRFLPQYRDEGEVFTFVCVPYKPETNFAIDPFLDTTAADVYDHGGSIRDGLFKSGHPVIARLQIVLVEPDVEAIAAQDFRELPGRLRVRPGVTEKNVAHARNLSRPCAHDAPVYSIATI